MPKVFRMLTVFLLFSTFIQAQTDSSIVDKGLNINFFNSYAVAYKWNTNESMTYRVYLNLFTSLSNQDSEMEYIFPDYKISDENQDHSDINLSLSFHFLFNILKSNNIKLYLGFGPIISYSYSSFEFNREINQLYVNKSENNSSLDSFGAGITALLGVEAFLTEKISLFAETHITGLREWQNSTDEHTDYYGTEKYHYKNKSTSTSWNASLQLVKIGLGLYF